MKKIILNCVFALLATASLCAQTPQAAAPTIDESTVEILLLSGNTITAQITEIKSNYVAYVLNGKAYTMPASQIEKVTFLQNGQVKEYNGHIIAAEETGSSSSISANTPRSGRIYRDNGHYMYNNTYIATREVENLLMTNKAAYKEWKKADGLFTGGCICIGIGGGLVLGGIFPLIYGQSAACIGIECSALVPLGIGLGLTLGASAHYTKAVDIYNSKLDHAAVQFKWRVAPTGVGFALAF